MFTLVSRLLVWFDLSLALAFRGLMETTLVLPRNPLRMRSWFPPWKLGDRRDVHQFFPKG
jgi:hypothetical protein